MSSWEALLLGIVQGLTEFLPISSSGHLILVEALLGIRDDSIIFEIIVHLGTLLAVLTYFKADLLRILHDFRSSPISKTKTGEEKDDNPGSPQGRYLFWLLIVATLPAATLGFALRGIAEQAAAHPRYVSGELIATGLILLASRFAKNKMMRLNSKHALVIGLAQVVSLMPGISRSGTTITAALFQGISPQESARFSFLMSVPIIFGVCGVQIIELAAASPTNHQLILLGIGCVSAYVSGLLAIKSLMLVMRKGRFEHFAYYCFVVGILGLIVF